VLICYIYMRNFLSLFCWLHVLFFFFWYLFVYLVSLVFFFFKKKNIRLFGWFLGRVWGLLFVRNFVLGERR